MAACIHPHVPANSLVPVAAVAAAAALAAALPVLVLAVTIAAVPASATREHAFAQKVVACDSCGDARAVLLQSFSSSGHPEGTG